MYYLQNILATLINTTNSDRILKHISTSNLRRRFSFDSFKNFANQQGKIAMQTQGKVICINSPFLEISIPKEFEFKFDPEKMTYTFQKKPPPKLLYPLKLFSK